ncbi:MAG: GYD domain-containing protein [Gemmatimonadetes bacterium]|nr:GYD domain-containing protein [Gemmatimonadota bacterium]
MATYISLIRFTEQGIKTIREGGARLDAAKQAYRAAGAEIKAFYTTMGQYDVVIVSEAPDDATVAKLAFTVGSLGNVRSETLRAFTEVEYRSILASLS